MTQSITARDIASSTATGADSQPIITGVPTANSVVSIPVLSEGEASITISGTWTGTLSFEGSSDGGVTYNPVDANIKGVNSVVQSTTANGTFIINTVGNQIIRVRSTAAMTGTAAIFSREQAQSDVQHVIVLNAAAITIGSFEGVDADGAPPTGNPVLVAGSDGTNVQTLLTDAGGRLLTGNNTDAAATLITLAAAGAGTFNSADQANENCSGGVIVVDLTVATTASVVVNIQGKDVASGKYYTILSSAALIAAGTTPLTVYPGAAAVANAVASLPLPKTWRVQAVITGVAAAVTGTIGASTIA